MKKVIKWTLFSLILGGIVALSLCYIIIPERTKSAVDVIIEYANKPLGIVCGTTITVGLVATIVIKLIYDRHKESIAEKLEQVKSFNASAVVDAKEYYEKALKEKEEVNAYLSNFNERIDNLTEQLCKVCETIPNAKIKALGEEIKNSDEQVAQTLENKLGELNSYTIEQISTLEERIKELEKVVSEYGKE